MAYYIPKTSNYVYPFIKSDWYLDEFLIDHNLSEYIAEIFNDYEIKAIVDNNRMVYNKYDKNFKSKSNILDAYCNSGFEMWCEFFSHSAHIEIYGDYEDLTWKVVFVSDGHIVKHYYFSGKQF